jgi:hypothetical protein
MSGARLCTLLGELGYEGTKSGSDSLDPDSFEWPFQYEDTRPILHWICSTLRPSNILSVSELSQFVTTLFFFFVRSFVITIHIHSHSIANFVFLFF